MKITIELNVIEIKNILDEWIIEQGYNPEKSILDGDIKYVSICNKSRYEPQGKD